VGRFEGFGENRSGGERILMTDRDHFLVDRWHSLAQRFTSAGGLKCAPDGRHGLRLKSSTVEELNRIARTCEIRMTEEEAKLLTLEGELVQRGQPFVRRTTAPPPPPPVEKKKKPRTRRRARAAPTPRPKPKRPRGICNCGCGEKITAPLRATQWYAAGHFRRVKPLAPRSHELVDTSTQKENQ